MGKTQLKLDRCLILGGGEIINYGAVRAQVAPDDFIVCADSGYLHCEKLGLKPDLLLGDFDSLESVPDGVERLVYSANKNYTDSTLAVRAVAERGYKRVLMAGMLGLRLDHTLGNLQNLAWCAENGIDAKITDGETEAFVVKNAEIVVPARENAYFSVFTLTTQSEGVTILNGKYPLDRYTLRFDEPRAVSNEFCGRDVSVTVENGVAAVIVTPKRPGDVS